MNCQDKSSFLYRLNELISIYYINANCTKYLGVLDR